MLSRRSDTDVAKVDARGGRRTLPVARRRARRRRPPPPPPPPKAQQTELQPHRAVALHPPSSLSSLTLVGTPAVALTSVPTLRSDTSFRASICPQFNYKSYFRDNDCFNIYLGSLLGNLRVARDRSPFVRRLLCPCRADVWQSSLPLCASPSPSLSLSLCLRISRAFFAEKAGRHGAAPLPLPSLPRMHV